MPYRDQDLASSNVEGSYTPIKVFAGDAPIVTEEEVTAVNAGAFQKYELVAKQISTGAIVKLNSAGSDGANKVYGVTTQAADATGGKEVALAVFTAGFFNSEILVVPPSFSGDLRAAVVGTQLRIGTVRL